MQSHKKHIVLLLLLGFLFPQAANSAHYFLVPHADYYGQKISVDVTGPGFEYHSCDYKLTSIKFWALGAAGWKPEVTDIFRDDTFHYKQGYFPIYNYHYSLRGPPEVLCIQIFTKSYPKF